MKPVIGLLLIAGGITLMYGLFTGKIAFPLGSQPITLPTVTPPAPTVTPPTDQQINSRYRNQNGAT